ncbi:UDP-glucose 4-epimerase GalE [Sphingomonas sp. URHD0057]|uniref:UDP-glucose 4-epimerase GalE n=1 Tax=Sphingomonas sp. URHD0057 TaxID=1380389 RepID=UPI00048EF6BA|nr:UDP-glucose 4-epimerase GalE [Sphingomonas sp. URHD0057]
MSKALIVGGAGYIGAHCCKAFAQSGWEVVAFDDLSRGWRDAVRWGPLIEGNLLDGKAIGAAVRDAGPDVVIHLAAFAYVGESVTDPALYYRNNSVGTLNLLDAMRDAGSQSLIFSSSCAVYGNPVVLPIEETHPRLPINPYGRSKLSAEMMIEDYSRAYGSRAVSLRYFNAAGADPDLEIGERHQPETHLLPLAIEAAFEPSAELVVMGTDFDTPDGTALRDYIHVTDLAEAHVAAAKFLQATIGYHAFNLGTGQGTSVLEVIGAVERASGKPPSYRPGPRREGDPAQLIASSSKANQELGWEATMSDIDTIARSAVAWRLRSESRPS